MLSSTVTKFMGKDTFELVDDEYLEMEAKLATLLIEKWGLVAAIPDGEDSAGRQKLKMQTPDELVQRAFAVASLAMKTARKRGLVYKCPPVKKSK